MSRHSTVRASWLLAGFGFLWPALLNGFPFLYYDVIGYLGGANLFAHAFFAAPIEWPQIPRIVGRSVYYGAFLLLSLKAGGFWVAATVQGLFAAGCVAMFLRYWPHVSVGIAGALLQATTLPFFVSFMLPDVLTGLAILSATALLLFWQRDGVATRAFWIAVATVAALAHSSNLPVLIALAVSGLVLPHQRRPWLAAAAIVAATLVGAMGERASAIGVERLTGDAPIRPPFVTARLTTDGPGTRYLRATCPANGFALCRYLARLPAATNDYFLWDDSSERGVFQLVSPADRQRIAAEDARFAWATFSHFPVATLATLASGTGGQLRLPRLEEFNYSPHQTNFFQSRLPPPTLAAVVRSRAFAGTMPTRVPLALMRVLTFVAALLCVRALLAASTPVDLRLTVALILIGLLANAAVCGGLSGANTRYADRILWLLPLAGLLTLGAPRDRIV